MEQQQFSGELQNTSDFEFCSNVQDININSWHHPVSIEELDATDPLSAQLIKHRLSSHASNEKDNDANHDRRRKTREPIIVRHMKMGACITRWKDPDYLIRAAGVDQPVSVHVSSTPTLDFLRKNFSYVTMTFKNLIDNLTQPAAAGDARNYYYYRAIAADSPRSKEAANFFRDFPRLAEDFKIPDFIEPSRIFSSVLRLSSPSVKMWLHYDVMDNILIQVHGRRRVLLFHPYDAKFLYMQGDKSIVREFFPVPDFEKFPLLRHCRPYTATLNSGDALFIPALWLHYIMMDDADENDHHFQYTIAVNIFWRHLEPKFYSDRDVYGNKDLLPAERAFDQLHRACKALNSLPEPYRTFYSDRAKQVVNKNLNPEQLVSDTVIHDHCSNYKLKDEKT